MITLALHDLEMTERLAQAIAPQLRTGDVVELHGDVGAGKTTFTGAVARALGALEPVRSPTYTVAHQYRLADGRSLAHLDCYREGGELGAEAWGDLEPYFEDGFACIEWPEPIAPWLRGRPTWRIVLRGVSIDARVAEVASPRPLALEPILDRLLRGGGVASPH